MCRLLDLSSQIFTTSETFYVSEHSLSSNRLIRKIYFCAIFMYYRPYVAFKMFFFITVIDFQIKDSGHSGVKKPPVTENYAFCANYSVE
jgi:hypothetical protein